MNIQLGNNKIKDLISMVAVLLFLGALLDAYSNAINIITPNITYILSGILAVIVLILSLLENKKILNVLYQDGSQWSIVDKNSIIIIMAFLLVLWIPRLGAATTITDSNLLTQTEILEISDLTIHEVFYPKPFSAIPNLTFSKKIGNVYCSSRYRVIEQRPDGFKVEITSVGDCHAIQWTAVGVLNKVTQYNK